MPNRHYRTLRHISLSIILTIFWNTGYSDDELIALNESYFYDDLPVVLSASRLTQSQADTPTAMTIIDRKMIQASTALNIPDLLRLVPGFTIGFLSDASITVSYHGHADEYARDMQVLIDGRSIYDPVYGGIPWSEIPLSLDEILRIEVVRGPNAAAYGSNSYAGVINIVTEHPADLLGTSLSTTVGYEKTRYIEASHAASSGKFDYRLSTSYREADGFENRDDSSMARWVKFDSDYKFDINNSVRTTFGASHGNYDEGLPTFLQSDRELENHYNFQSIEWSRVLSDNNKLNVQFYHNYYYVNDLKQTPKISDQISSFDELSEFDEAVRPDIFAAAFSGGRYDFDSLMSAMNLTDSPLLFSWLGLKSHRYDLEIEHTTEPVDDFRIVWGFGARHDRGESFWLLHSDKPITRNLYRLFLNSEWYATPKIVVNAGGMLEKFEGKERIFSPRLGVNYHFNTSNTVRLSGSRAYRMPTIHEDNAHITIQLGVPGNDFKNWVISTEELDPQQIDRIEAGYFGNFTEYGLNVDLCVFHETYSDIIDQYRNFDYPDPGRGITDPFDAALLSQFLDLYQRGAFTYSNYGNVHIDGIEFELNYRPTVRDMLYFGFSYLDISGNEIKRLKDGVFSYRENAEEKIPEKTFSIIASHTFNDGLTMSSAYYFTDEMEWPGEGDAVPNYSRLDLKFNKLVNLSNTNINLSLLLQNIHKKNTDFYNNDRIDSHNVWNKRIYFQAKIAL